MIVSDAVELTAAWFAQGLGRAVHERADRADGHRRDVPDGPCRADLGRTAMTGPASVVVKFPTAEDAARLALARAMGMYELEVRFYRDLLHDARRRPNARVAISPNWIERDRRIHPGARGSQRPDPARRRPHREQRRRSARACSMSSLRLQAARGTPRRPGACRGSPTRHGPRDLRLDARRAGAVPRPLRRTRWSPSRSRCSNACIPQAGEWIRSWDGPSVVQHGDLRTDNILFGPRRRRAAATMLDFQTVRVGPPGIDPAYFLGSSLSDADPSHVRTRPAGRVPRTPRAPRASRASTSTRACAATAKARSTRCTCSAASRSRSPPRSGSTG